MCRRKLLNAGNTQESTKATHTEKGKETHQLPVFVSDLSNEYS